MFPPTRPPAAERSPRWRVRNQQLTFSGPAQGVSPHQSRRAGARVVQGPPVGAELSQLGLEGSPK